MTIVGSGSYRYEVVDNWATLPEGWTFGGVSAVATDSQDRVYAFQRQDPPGAHVRPGRELSPLVGYQRYR